MPLMAMKNLIEKPWRSQMANQKHGGTLWWTAIGGQASKGCRGKTVVSCDEDNVSFAAEMPRYSAGRVVPLNIFPDSSHRDGSIYKGTSGWKRDFCVVDRRESK